MNREFLGELFGKAVKTSGVAGMQLSLIKEGEQLDFVHGFANAELGIPMTPDTVIQIGSVTKVFNALMVMSLVEEGKLDLDEPVKGYIPALELSDPQATRQITLRHLLSMSGGVDNGDYADYGEADNAIENRVMALRNLPQHFVPGAHFGYSNAGIDISGHAAERVTGRIWDDLLRERVLELAGLRNAVSLARDRLFHRISLGHTVDPKTGKVSVVRPWVVQSRGQGPGGCSFATSAHDLARFGRLFIDGGIGDSGARVLSRNGIETMMTSQIEVPVHRFATSWCLGPAKHTWNGVPIWGHHGGSTSGMSFLYWIPEKKGILACTLNTASAYGRLLKSVTQEIMQAAFGIANPEVEWPESRIEVDPGRYVGTYECIAGQCLIEAADEKLVMKTRYELIRGVKMMDTSVLVPLGDDRFLLDRGADADPMTLRDDVAFFGTDRDGRATNLTRKVFPASRVS